MAVRGASRRIPGSLPLALMAVLMVAIGAYTRARSPAFLSQFNLNSLLLSTLPLALVAMAQFNALLVGGFDVSVGQLMTLVVVLASFVLGPELSLPLLVLAAFLLVGVGVLAGFLNAGLIRGAGLPPIIATIATLSVLQGLSLMLRPVPGGRINFDVMIALTKSVGFVPIGFIGVVGLAILWDLWLYRSKRGLITRAVGFDETSTGRIGIRPGWIHVRAYVFSGLLAALAGLFLAAQVGVGDARVGAGFTLPSIAAAVLGGASLLGGRGSFLGACVGGLFLALIVNILPFLGWSSALGQISVGALTLLALMLYQGNELWSRVRGTLVNLRVSRAG
jgi:ribose transport system ATP-binding protein